MPTSGRWRTNSGPSSRPAIFELAPGPWQGPIESSQGLHLVHVTALVPAQLRPFDEIKEQLVELWHEESRRENEERYFVGLLKKYQLVPDESVKALAAPLIEEQAAGAKGPVADEAGR